MDVFKTFRTADSGVLLCTVSPNAYFISCGLLSKKRLVKITQFILFIWY